MRRGVLALCSSVLVLAAACGKQGPPLPPLIRLPIAPVNVVASRHASEVAIEFTVPGRNTDNTTPADLARVDIYALNGPLTSAPDEIFTTGRKVGSVVVNQPADPDEEQDGSEKKKKSKHTRPRDGVDQNTLAHFSDTFDVPEDSTSDEVRAYVAVGFNERGRRGAFSPAVRVPLGPPPPAPADASVTYTETTITVTWHAPATDAGPIASFHVYDADDGHRLSTAPVTATKFDDSRIEWGAMRCYLVRSLVPAGTLTLESAASPTACATLKDTFAPAAPVGLTGVPFEGGIDLIWDNNNEKDLAGYIVLRAIAPDESLKPITTELLTQPTFRDKVPSGATATYAVQAVDKAGNASPMSARFMETAR